MSEILNPNLAYLAKQIMPQQTLTLRPFGKSKYVELVTPVGRLMWCNVVEPSVYAGDDDKDAELKTPTYTVRLLFAPGTAEHPIVADIHNATALLANDRFPHGIEIPDPQTGQAQLVSADELFFVPIDHGGFHYPLRAGTALYTRDMVKNADYRGMYYINASMYSRGYAKPPNIGVEQRPVLLDRDGNVLKTREQWSVFYPGCFARAIIWLKWFEVDDGRRQSRGVKLELKGLQYDKAGDHLGGGYTETKAQATLASVGGLLPSEPAASNEGYGPNTGTHIPAGVQRSAPPMEQGFPRPAVQPNGATPPAATPGYVPAAVAARPRPVPGGVSRPPGV